jgi:hypothetical protein
MFQYRGERDWLRPHPLAGWGDGLTYGAAQIPGLLAGDPSLRVVFSDATEAIADGWEHVSVSTETRTPTWAEMVRVKRLFWGDEDVVLQFHPRRSEYVNRHEHCLHLWRHTIAAIPCPPKELVG